MKFVIICMHCWKGTKYDALDEVTGLPCDKCGEILCVDHTHSHTVRYASNTTLPVMTADYAKNVMIVRKIMSKCITCNQTKDKFSQDWDYQQCQTCSMKGEDNGL